MKKVFYAFLLIAAAIFTGGCGTGFPNGLLYTQLNVPVVVNSSDTRPIADYHKGEAKGSKLFGLFVWGDASYAAAVRNAGGFSRIQRVEYFSYDICGCGYFGIRVLGEPIESGKVTK